MKRGRAPRTIPLQIGGPAVPVQRLSRSIAPGRPTLLTRVSAKPFQVGRRPLHSVCRPTEAARKRLTTKAAAQASEGEAQSRCGEPSCGKWNERPGMLIVVGGFRRCQPYLHCGCLLGFRCRSIERRLHQFDWFGLKNRCYFAHDILLSDCPLNDAAMK